MRTNIKDQLFSMIEPLSAIEHERWSHWQSYLHSKCLKNSDGSLTIPSELVKKWEQQMTTSYSKLSEKEKQSDRDQVDVYLQYIASNIESMV